MNAAEVAKRQPEDEGLDDAFYLELQKEAGLITEEEPAVEEPTGSGDEPSTDNSDTVDTETVEPTETETEVGTTGSGEVPSTETPAMNPEYEKLKSQVQNLEALMGRQTNELGRLRQIENEYNEQRKILDDPTIQQALGQALYGNQQGTQQKDFDFTDPGAIDQRVEAKVQSILQKREAERKQNEAVERQRMIQSATEAEKMRMLASGVITEAELNASVSTLFNEFMGGKAPLIAHWYANRQKEIKEAEERGKNEAIKKLNQKTNQPATLSKATASQRAQQATDDGNYDNMSLEELEAEAKKLPPESKNWAKIMGAFDKLMKK